MCQFTLMDWELFKPLTAWQSVHALMGGRSNCIYRGTGRCTGDLLAEIDPRPFQTQLDQASAKKAQDEAQFTVAKLTLSRDKELLAPKILAQQDIDVQQATVDQLQATVQADQAAINNARTQLGYTSIRSPLDGRIGIAVGGPRQYRSCQ